MIDRLTGANFSAGRDGEHVEMVIVHWTVGTAESAIARFLDPTARVSAHYVIDREGIVYRVVAEADTAWHAGDWATNLRSVGIEHDAGPFRDPTTAQYAASARLVRAISARYGIPVDAQHIRPHRAIVATQCPGTLDVDRIVREASQEVKVTREEYATQIEPLVKETIRVMLAEDAAAREAVASVSKDPIDALARRYGVHGHTTSGPTGEDGR